ncbi:MAG: hypothetical protein EU530_11265 [Promethearchaeota archaeon]|nr:MAG: hypothetical protein EU530_11265 [Candidatus Lokiarchaeota archaeon]
MAEIKDILVRIGEIFDEINLNYVIVDGLAAIIRGKPRTTMDIDVIIEDNEPKINLLLGKLKTRDFDVLDEQIKLAFQSGVNASIFDELSPMRLDVKIARKPIDIAVLNSAESHDYFGVTVKIASLNFILLGKIWFLGDISDVAETEFLEYNDIKDFINVYLENEEQVDMFWLENEVEKLKLSSTLARILEYIKENLDF